MAEEQEERSRDDLSEEASPYRVEEYRSKGRVAQSREITGLVAMLAAGVGVYALSPHLGSQTAEFMKEVFRTDLSSRVDLGGGHVLSTLFFKALKIGASIALPVCIAGFILGALGSFAQIGSIFSTEPLNPDLTKIDPIKGLKRLFSLKQLYDGFRLILKMVAVVLIAYSIVKTEAIVSARYLLTEPAGLIPAFGGTAKVMFLALVGALAVFAAGDYWLQKWEYGKSVRLTKQEAKQEFKEREGDPQIKARIRSIQREVARRRMMQAVKTADVVVTNPTHFAVAISYDREKMSAPKVVAKGADLVAQKIKKIAADSGVPMVENVPLARTLFKSVKIGQAIPRVLYQAVAEVLAYVYRLKGRRL